MRAKAGFLALILLCAFSWGEELSDLSTPIQKIAHHLSSDYQQKRPKSSRESLAVVSFSTSEHPQPFQ